MNTMVLVTIFDGRPFDRLAIKDYAVVLQEFADVTEDLFYVSYGRGAQPSKSKSFVGRWVSPVQSVKSIAPLSTKRSL